MYICVCVIFWSHIFCYYTYNYTHDPESRENIGGCFVCQIRLTYLLKKRINFDLHV